MEQIIDECFNETKLTFTDSLCKALNDEISNKIITEFTNRLITKISIRIITEISNRISEGITEEISLQLIKQENINEEFIQNLLSPKIDNFIIKMIWENNKYITKENTGTGAFFFDI